MQALRDGTQSYWSFYWLNNAYDGSVISLFLGPLVLVWCSRRGPFGVFLPRPVFLARVISGPSGSSIVGRFGGPAPEPFLLIGLALVCLFLFATEGLQAALLALVLYAVVFSWVARRSLASDQPVIEKCFSVVVSDANA